MIESQKKVLGQILGMLEPSTEQAEEELEKWSQRYEQSHKKRPICLKSEVNEAQRQKAKGMHKKEKKILEKKRRKPS